MFTLCLGLLLIKGYFCLKVTTSTEISVTLKSNSSIILNCTYELEGNDKIKNVLWKKKISGVYNELANVYENEAYYTAAGIYLKTRSELHAFGNGSTSVVLIIKGVQCLDNGNYQCLINYDDGKVLQTAEKNTVVYIQANAEEPKVFSVQPNNSLEEHGMVTLSCVGDVGNPQGSLIIWKIYEKKLNTKQLIKNESEVKSDTENCTHIVNLTTSYNLTKEDNGAVFRCSSQNQYTTEPAPAIDIKPIDVFYGPSTTRIKSFFSLSDLNVGDLVEFKCISDGNPNPNYTWIFNFTYIVSDGKYNFSANKSELSFTITNITDSGYYNCVASNYFNGKRFNSSSNVTLLVQEKKHDDIVYNFVQNCPDNPCSLIQSCIPRNGSAYCSLNIWSVITFVFITLTLIFGTACISLTLSRRRQKKIMYKNGRNIGDVHVSYTRETFEDFGGYADPKDVKRPENGQIKSDKDGRDNPYADPVDFQTQYAVVQKNWETPAKSSKDANTSDTSNLLNNTDSSNTANPSSSETTNPQNSTSDEKTPGSTETSETISKPPNVNQSPTNYINLLLE